MADAIQIHAPDGSIAEFPAGTTDDTIKAVMGKAYPPAAAAPSQPSTLQSLRESIHAPTRALENGLMMGLGDRARALIDSVLSGGGYGEHLKAEQGDTDAFAVSRST